MDNISLKVTSRYKSLQEGFEWNNIPPFAVITGVNGVGKTQLLDVIKGRSERPDIRGIIPQINRELSLLTSLGFSFECPHWQMR